MRCIKIALTGAPGTGKTAVINELEAKGFVCFHEVIRSMTAKEKQQDNNKEVVSNPLLFADDPKKFNQSLIEARTAHFLKSDAITESFCFFDRGIPDVLAYMDYFDQSYPEDFTKKALAHPYDHIFIMPPWEAIYVCDNERLETFAQAGELHQHLMETYVSLGYTPVIVPKTTVEKRITFILDYIKRG